MLKIPEIFLLFCLIVKSTGLGKLLLDRQVNFSLEKLSTLEINCHGNQEFYKLNLNTMAVSL